MASILDILGWRNISRSITKVETGIPDRVPPQFFAIREPVLGETTTFATFYGQRQTARRVEYGAPSVSRTLRPVGEQTVKLLQFHEHILLRQELLIRLRNPDDLLAQEMAQKEIARHGADLRTLFDNTRVAMVTSMLHNGKIWFDSAGNVLPSASGAAFTIDYGIPATNTGQLNPGSGAIIDASWATSNTNIALHLTRIDKQMVFNSGRRLKNIGYGTNIPSYLFRNDTLKTYWQYNPSMYQQFAQNPGIVPQGFAGYNWWPMGDAFYEDASGTQQSLWGGDTCTFLPEIDFNCYTFYEGTILTPKSWGISEDAMTALGNFEKTTGLGGYAVPQIDPVAIKQVGIDTCLPMWKTPRDMFIADVTP